MTQKRTLVLATHNRHKITETTPFLADKGFDITSAADLNVPEVEETGTTFLENAMLKARFVAQYTGHLVLADDSGMCIDALDGAPGVTTADYATRPDGVRDYPWAFDKLHDALRVSGAPQPWTAGFVSVIVLAAPDGEFAVFQGECKGHLVWPPRGEIEFGFDPIFVPEGEERTFSQMTKEEKAFYSHRARALRALLNDWPDFAR